MEDAQSKNLIARDRFTLKTKVDLKDNFSIKKPLIQLLVFFSSLFSSLFCYQNSFFCKINNFSMYVTELNLFRIQRSYSVLCNALVANTCYMEKWIFKFDIKAAIPGLTQYNIHCFLQRCITFFNLTKLIK
jgi:hypothetical protein